MTSGRLVRFIVARGRDLARLWQWLGDVDRVLARSYVPPDCAFVRATALVADSAVVRFLATLFGRFDREGSVAIATAVAASRALQQLSRWQIVRLAGIALTTAVIVHAALYLVLPWRFGERLPAIVWVAVAALAMTLIAAPRQLVAAWDEWRR